MKIFGWASPGQQARDTYALQDQITALRNQVRLLEGTIEVLQNDLARAQSGAHNVKFIDTFLGRRA